MKGNNMTLKEMIEWLTQMLEHHEQYADYQVETKGYYDPYTRNLYFNREAQAHIDDDDKVITISSGRGD